MGCLYCGKEISTIRLMRDEDFCCDKHRSLHHERLRKALLTLSLPDPAPARAAEFIFEMRPAAGVDRAAAVAAFQSSVYRPVQPSAHRLRIDPIMGDEFCPLLPTAAPLPQDIRSTPVWDSTRLPAAVRPSRPAPVTFGALALSLESAPPFACPAAPQPLVSQSTLAEALPAVPLLGKPEAAAALSAGARPEPCAEPFALAVTAAATPTQAIQLDPGWQEPSLSAMLPPVALTVARDEEARPEAASATVAVDRFATLPLQPAAVAPVASAAQPMAAVIAPIRPGYPEQTLAAAPSPAPAAQLELQYIAAAAAPVPAVLEMACAAVPVCPALGVGIVASGSLEIADAFADQSGRPAALQSAPAEAYGAPAAEVSAAMPGFAGAMPARPAPVAADAFVADHSRPAVLVTAPILSFETAAPQAAMRLTDAIIPAPAAPAPAAAIEFAAGGLQPVAIPAVPVHPSAGRTAPVQPVIGLPSFRVLTLADAAPLAADAFLEQEAQPADPEPVLSQVPETSPQIHTLLPQPNLQLSQPPVAEMADVMPSESVVEPRLAAPAGTPASVRPHASRLPALPAGFHGAKAQPLAPAAMAPAVQNREAKPAHAVAEFLPVLTSEGLAALERRISSLGEGWLELAGGAELPVAPLAQADSSVAGSWMVEGLQPAMPAAPLSAALGDAAAFTEAPSEAAGFAVRGVRPAEPAAAQPRAGLEKVEWVATLATTVPPLPQQPAPKLAPALADIVPPELRVQPGRPPLSRREEWNNPRMAVVLPRVTLSAALVPLEQLVRKSEVTEITPKPAKAPRYNRSDIGFWGKGIAAGIAIGAFISVGTMAYRAPRGQSPTESAPAVALNMPPGRPGTGLVHQVRQAIASRATLEISNDFRSGQQFWDGGRADWGKGWSRHPDGYVKTGGLSLFRPSLRLTDYRLEFMAQIENKSMGWVIRAQDTGNYYAMKFNVVEPGLRPIISVVRYPVVNGKRGRRVEIPLQVMMHNNTPYRVAVDVRGNHFVTSIEGEQVDSFSDDTLRLGGVGFFSENTERARLYWMKITNNDDLLGHICAYLSGRRGAGQGDDGGQRAFVDTDTWRDSPGRPFPVERPVVAVCVRRQQFGMPVPEERQRRRSA